MGMKNMMDISFAHFYRDFTFFCEFKNYHFFYYTYDGNRSIFLRTRPWEYWTSAVHCRS